MALCFVHFDQPEPTPPSISWLGAFVVSDGERVVFFPGYANPPVRFESFHGQAQMANRECLIDHISLESNFQSWHATSLPPIKHFGGPATLSLGEGRVLWFGMSVATPQSLRVVRKQTVVEAPVPEADAQRRMAELESSRESIQYPLVSLPSTSGEVGMREFYHFAAIVGLVGFPDYSGTEHDFPQISPCLLDPLPAALSPLPAKSCRLSLSPHCDIQITAMRLPGSLRIPISFTGPSVPQTK